MLYVIIKIYRFIVYFFYGIKFEDVNIVYILMYYVGFVEMFFKFLYLSLLSLNGKCLN